MNIQSNQKALLAAFFCNFFWGLSFLASRIALNEASVSVLLSHRFLVAFIVMSIYVLLGHLLLPVVLFPDKAQRCARRESAFQCARLRSAGKSRCFDNDRRILQGRSLSFQSLSKQRLLLCHYLHLESFICKWSNDGCPDVWRVK